MEAPNSIKFHGALYILAKDSDKKKKKEEKSGGANVRIRGDGISFYINVLLRVKDAEKIPFARQAKTIPDSVHLTADQLDEALVAKKAGELYHIYIADEGWFWKGESKDTSKIEDIQKILDLLDKYKERARNPVIYAVVSNKIAGKW